MDEPVVLTFDIATHNIKAMLITQKGDIIALEQLTYDEPYFSKYPNWAEQKPNFYFEKIGEVTQKLKLEYADLFQNIIAVTVTAMRDTVLCIDKNKKPLRNFILWADKRDSDHAFKKLPFIFRFLVRFSKVYYTLKKQLRMAPYHWIMEHERDIWAQTDKYVMISSYLNYQLTGNLIDSVANMVGYVPMNFKKRKWFNAREVHMLISNFDHKKLIELCEPGDIVGHITEKCAETTGIPSGLPLVATASDKACEALGSSVTGSNQISVNFSSTISLQVCSKHYFTPMTFVPSYPSAYKKNFNAEVQIFKEYWLATWFKREIATEEALKAEELGVSIEEVLWRKIVKIPAGCNGLMLQAAWEIELNPFYTQGSFIGFSDSHTHLHMYKAIIEGIGFSMLEGMLTMQKRSKCKITEAYVSGIPSKNNKLCQLMANISGIPIHRIKTTEVAGAGASMIAFVTLGIYDNIDEAIKNMCHITKTFNPNLQEHEIYKKLFFDVYLKMFSKLDPLYRKIINLKEQY